MRIIPLEKETLPDFAAYCLRHRAEVDESFLYDKDLEEFMIGPENPTVLAVDNSGRVVGAGSAIADEYMRRGNRARVRILHAEDDAAYEGMFAALLPDLAGLGRLYAYAPERNRAQMDAFLRLGFAVDRYSFVMVREDAPIADDALPEGFSIAKCRRDRDEQAWCDVRNAAFAALRGSETPMTAEMAAGQLFGEQTLPGGALMLRHGQTPVGIVRAAPDTLDGRPAVEIGPLAVLPGWQGRGLGRLLLRSALRAGRENGYRRAVLCVNAENGRAAGLYEKEGFYKAEVAVCFHIKLPEPQGEREGCACSPSTT